MSESSVIRLEREFDAPIGRVFDAWLDPESIAQWMCPAEGVRVPKPKLDARVGGAFDFTMDVRGEVMPHVGEYTQIDRPTLLEFTWRSPGTHDLETRVTLELEELPNDRTMLRLRHRLLPDETAEQSHSAGWGRILDCLGQELSR